MSSTQELDRTFLYFLIFTIISSALAFHIVVKAYDSVFELTVIGQ